MSNLDMSNCLALLNSTELYTLPVLFTVTVSINEAIGHQNFRHWMPFNQSSSQRTRTSPPYWLGCRSPCGGLSLPCARSIIVRWSLRVNCQLRVSKTGQLSLTSLWDRKVSSNPRIYMDHGCEDL